MTWVTLEVDPGFVVHVKGAKRADGSFVLAGLMVEGDIDSTVLQRLKPARLLARITPMLRVIDAVDGSADDDDGVTLGVLRAQVPERRPRSPRRKLLGRPDGGDGFYERVAAAYRSATETSDTPAVVLAGENDVPVETMRRWIKEARRRGLLEPGRKGRAG